MIGFQRGARRADAQETRIFLEQFFEVIKNGFLIHFFQLTAGLSATQRFTQAQIAVYVFVTEPAAIANKVAVHFFVVAAGNAPNGTVAFSGNNITAKTAILANRRCGGQIPLACVMFFKSLIRENTGRANFNQIAAEFILQNSVFVPAEINAIARGKNIEIAPACVIPIKTDTAVTGNTTVHFVINKRPEILIFMRAFVVFVPAVIVAGH